MNLVIMLLFCIFSHLSLVQKSKGKPEPMFRSESDGAPTHKANYSGQHLREEGSDLTNTS